MLVRLAQQDTDERHGDLTRVARASAEAAKTLEAHDAAAADETSRGLGDPDALAAMASWLPHAARNRAPLQQRAAELDRHEDIAREALRDAIARRKRLEIAMETVQAEHRRQVGKRTEQRADERETSRNAQVGATE